ncbi:MAG: M23 family metallopeptidase [Planctomycetes bacterium]|nr:M23 family metallopeptidase [Planctomycetota bacterium]
MPTDPLKVMKIRDNCSTSNTYGNVRDGGKKPHQGWDIDAKVNTSIYAIADGTIEFIEDTDSGDYGRQICLKFTHNSETLYAFYAHLSTISVKKGDTVKEGAELGYSGKTGNAKSLAVDQEHLHFEIRTSARPGTGLTGRKDPGDVLGKDALTCK